MSVHVLGYRVCRRSKAYKPGKTNKVEPLSRVYHSHDAAVQFRDLAEKEHPEFEVFVQSVQGAEPGPGSRTRRRA